MEVGTEILDEALRLFWESFLNSAESKVCDHGIVFIPPYLKQLAYFLVVATVKCLIYTSINERKQLMVSYIVKLTVSAI